MPEDERYEEDVEALAAAEEAEEAVPGEEEVGPCSNPEVMMSCCSAWKETLISCMM